MAECAECAEGAMETGRGVRRAAQIVCVARANGHGRNTSCPVSTAFR